MFDIFGEVKKHIATSGKARPKVTSTVLYTMKLCMLITVFGCLMVTAKNFIGDNINCVTNDLDLQEHKAVENYCFIMGTFTVPYIAEETSAHPGVGPIFQNPGEISYGQVYKNHHEMEEVHVHNYYQWVPIVLALQAGLFYLPVLLWKYLDRELFETTICQLHVVHIDPEEAKKNIEASSQYFYKTLRQHVTYAVQFLTVEGLSVAIAIGNIFLTNAFLDGYFFGYGPAAIDYLNTATYDVNNPLNQIFPKVAKCTWYKFGPTGTIQHYDSLCVLPLNIVNEKTYIFLWFCYIIAAVVVSAIFIFHVVVFMIRKLRNYSLLRLPMKSNTRDRLRNILKKGNLGDWFLIWNYKSHMMYFGEWAKAVDELLSQ